MSQSGIPRPVAAALTTWEVTHAKHVALTLTVRDEHQHTYLAQTTWASNNNLFKEGKYERKEGRKEGRKGGRKEGKKEGRRGREEAHARYRPPYRMHHHFLLLSREWVNPLNANLNRALN